MGFQETAEFHYVPQRSEFQGPDGCAAAGLAGRRHQYIKITFQDTATFVPAFYQKHQYDVAYIGGTGDSYPDALRPYASWGNMLNAAVSIEVIQSMPWIWIPPGLAVTLTVLAINFVGDAPNTRAITPH